MLSSALVDSGSGYCSQNEMPVHLGIGDGWKGKTDIEVITLLGNVLPIGGLNEKVVAAIRAGVKEVILPKLNEKDLKELPETVRHGVKFRLVETMDEVLQIAMNPPPVVAPEIAAGGLGAAENEPPAEPGDEQVPLAH